MKQKEKSALIRILYDLILADTVIDAGEMEYYAIVRSEFKFDSDDELEASKITFAEALSVLREADADTRKSILHHCDKLTVSDGFCHRAEALLMTAIYGSLNDDVNEIVSVISIPKHVFNIPNTNVLYIESNSDNDSNRQIESNYRSIFAEFRLAGFEFIHIPHIIRHYRESEPSLVRSIVSFISPKLSETGLNATIEKLLSMTTAEFTKDILCNKLEMNEMRNTEPALLLKIGSSFIGEEVYSNYLKISLEGNVVELVQRFLDNFTSMLSSDVSIVSNNKEQHNQFFYTGFYKLLLDAHLLRKNVRSRIFINPYREEIYFPDIDARVNGLHRKEKALYLLLLIKSNESGICFTPPASSHLMDNYNKRMSAMQVMFNKIYGMFGGGKQAPDLSVSSIRSPMISLIRKVIGNLSNELYNPNDYSITKDASDSFHIGIDRDLVYVWDYKSAQMVKLNQWSEDNSLL